MIKPASFVKKYNTVLFDMDGVITSEQRYWDCAALTIHQYLNKDINPAKAMSEKSNIRKKIFFDDKILLYLKKSGVNSNWDVTYIVLSLALALGETNNFAAVFQHLQELGLNALQLYRHLDKTSPLGKRGADVYNGLVRIFQEWYLGDRLFKEIWGIAPGIKDKKGLIWYEEPIIPLKNIEAVLKTLKGFGISLGIGTGRARFEAVRVLEKWGIVKYFDENKCITYTEITEAEKSTGIKHLTKPNPYTFLKGMLGKNFSDTDIISANYDKTLTKKVLVIGDASADLMAAQAADMNFAAVLTGISGQGARDYFLKHSAHYILNNVNGLIERIETADNGKDKCYNPID